LLVVDGHQRLKTIHYFFSETFEDGKPFRLKGVKSMWEGKKYTDLKETERRYLRNSVLRSTIFEQTDPKDKTIMFEIFNRLNTGGMPLSSQEIRNCLYGGGFLKMLFEINNGDKWRSLLGSPQPDKRMRDIEMIIRFFALREKWRDYQKRMRDFLTDYVADNRNPTDEEKQEYVRVFNDVINKIYDELGANAFKIQKGINAAVFDSITVALAEIGINKVEKLKAKYKELLGMEAYRDSVSKWTTDTDRVTGRIKMASGKFS
jgi:hypothetical protein